MNKNIFETLQLKKVINASGRMTKLGVSTLSEEVQAAMNSASSNYVEIDSLMKRAGEIISEYTHAEASMPTNSASAGIALASAAVLEKDKTIILMQAGHMIDYGAPIKDVIEISEAQIKLVGSVNKVTEHDFYAQDLKHVAAIFYVQSHHTVQKGMLKLEKIIKIAEELNLPVIVDAAAEDDFSKYIDSGADLVIYSGSKALSGPTSGFVTGRKQYIDKIETLNYKFGRSMKIGKESIAGLLKALELYHLQDSEALAKENKEKAMYLVEKMNALTHFKAQLIQDEAGRPIYRAQLSSDTFDMIRVNELLKNSDPAIYCRDHQLNQGYLNFDVRSIDKKEMDIIIEVLNEIKKE